MVLNYIWVSFFLIAFVFALFKLIFMGDMEIFPRIVENTFEMARSGFEISIWLTGLLALWMGLLKVGEKSGVIGLFARLVSPFFTRIFPEVPKDHPAMGSILMNFSANMLGLDNAGTPIGLKAMRELQSFNPQPETASNAQIMFLVLNTSGLTIIPITIILYRAQMGAVHPSDVFIPILLATTFSTFTGLLLVALYQRINLLDPVILTWLGGLLVFVGGTIWFFNQLEESQVTRVSALVSNVVLFSVIIFFLTLAAYRKVNAYETFIEGAKEGFEVAVGIIPYLVAMLVAIGVFRASGAMNEVVEGVRWGLALFALDGAFVDALPTALMKPLTGSGARGMMIETMKTFGPDSFAGRLACTFQGSTDTTLYVIAVYFGSVRIRKTRYALTCGLLADLSGAIAAIFIAYMFF